jgi:hypothetical protein
VSGEELVGRDNQCACSQFHELGHNFVEEKKAALEGLASLVLDIVK